MLSPADAFRAMDSAEQEATLAELEPEVAAALLYDWRFWARPDQLAPSGYWRTWLILAGRGFGKTRCGAEWVRDVAAADPGCRIALVGLTAADARDVMVEGESGILAVHPEDERPLYEPSKRRLTWPNGSMATCYNASEPDQLRGPQHHYAWVDEYAKFPAAQELWDQLAFGMRLGQKPRSVVTTTPRPIPAIKRLMADASTVVTRGKTLDNRTNLAPGAVDALVERYAGTRLGRQELDGEIVDDVVGALWTRSMLDANRAVAAPEMARVVVAIDPSGTDGNDDGDDVGIVVAGRGVDGRGYVLADRTCRLSPDGWARMAITAYHAHQADRIVAERNFGGAMVAAVIRAADRSVPYKEVTASRGKVARAEPVSALFEQGRVSIVGSLPELEDEMVLMTGAGFVGEGSPNRVDALVWALSEVMLAHQAPDRVLTTGKPLPMVTPFANRRRA
jgi:predicted phage terminase large subunit-like protein